VKCFVRATRTLRNRCLMSPAARALAHSHADGRDGVAAADRSVAQSEPRAYANGPRRTASVSRSNASW